MGQSTMDNPEKPCPVYGEIVNYDIKYTSINMEDDQHLYEGCLVNQTSDKIQQRKYRWGNQQWTIQRNWQYMIHKTKTNKKHNIS
jgi:hypothetical protein